MYKYMHTIQHASIYIRTQKVIQSSRDSWMYPGPNVPRHRKSLQKRPIARGYLWVFDPQESLENTINTWVHVRYGCIQLSHEKNLVV